MLSALEFTLKRVEKIESSLQRLTDSQRDILLRTYYLSKSYDRSLRLFYIGILVERNKRRKYINALKGFEYLKANGLENTPKGMRLKDELSKAV